VLLLLLQAALQLFRYELCRKDAAKRPQHRSLLEQSILIIHISISILLLLLEWMLQLECNIRLLLLLLLLLLLKFGSL
jgi:hypothetical protein